MDNTQNNASESINCPECDTPIQIKQTVLGTIVECINCGTQSEIVELNPLKLSPLEEEK